MVLIQEESSLITKKYSGESQDNPSDGTTAPTESASAESFFFGGANNSMFVPSVID